MQLDQLEATISKIELQKDRLLNRVKELHREILINKTNISNNINKGIDAVKTDIEELKKREIESSKISINLSLYNTLKQFKENSIKSLDVYINDFDYHSILSCKKLFNIVDSDIELSTTIDLKIINRIDYLVMSIKPNADKSIIKSFLLEFYENYSHLSIVDLNIYINMVLNQKLGDMYGFSLVELLKLLNKYDEMKKDLIYERNNERP